MDFDKELEYGRKGVVIYVLVVSAFIIITYAFFGGLLLLAFGEGDIESNPMILALNEILFLFIPAVLASLPLNFGWRKILRFNFPGFKFLLIASLGIIFFQIFTEGWIILQGKLIPFFWRFEYQRMIEEYSYSMKNLIGSGSIMMFLQSLFVVSIVPAVSEETLFRGFIQTTLEHNIKIKYAVIFSAVLFGAIHLNLVYLVPLVLVGAYFGIAGYFSKSLIIPIILHFLTNLISTINVFYFNNVDSSNIYDVSLMSSVFLFVFGLAGLLGITFWLYRMRIDIKTSIETSSSNDG